MKKNHQHGVAFLIWKELVSDLKRITKKIDTATIQLKKRSTNFPGL